MTASESSSAPPSHSLLETWLRVGLVAGAVWAAFRYVVEPRVLAYESHFDPLVLHAGRYGILGGVVVAALLRLALIAATRTTGNTARGLVSVCIGLMFWSLRDQTIDQWLIARNPSFQAPSGALYWPLLLDFALLALGLVPLALVRKLTPSGAALAADEDHTIGPADLRGLLAMTVFAIVVVPFLMGPAASDTRVKQVFFAVSAGLPISRWAARKLTNVNSIGGSWLMPFVLGVLGVAVASVRPTFSLPASYQALTETPAWGLVRPLPLQWICVGLATILWNSAFPIRMAAAHPSEAAAAKAP